LKEVFQIDQKNLKENIPWKRVEGIIKIKELNWLIL
jgi:hypothetical protein